MPACCGFTCVVQCHVEILIVLWQWYSSLSMVCCQNWGTHFLSKAAWWAWMRYWGNSQHKKVLVCISEVLSWFCSMQYKHKQSRLDFWHCGFGMEGLLRMVLLTSQETTLAAFWKNVLVSDVQESFLASAVLLLYNIGKRMGESLFLS